MEQVPFLKMVCDCLGLAVTVFLPTPPSYFLWFFCTNTQQWQNALSTWVLHETVFLFFFNILSCSLSVMPASHLAMVLFGWWWARISLYVLSAHWTLKSLDIRTLHLHLVFSALHWWVVFFVRVILYLRVPKLPFREFTALLPSFFSPWLSLLRFSLRETWQVAVRGLSSSPSTSLLCDLEQVITFLRYSVPSVLRVLQSAGS